MNISFIAVLHFSHSRVFNNENNSYPKMSVKRPLACSWYILHLGILPYWCHSVQ